MFRTLQVHHQAVHQSLHKRIVLYKGWCPKHVEVWCFLIHYCESLTVWANLLVNIYKSALLISRQHMVVKGTHLCRRRTDQIRLRPYPKATGNQRSCRDAGRNVDGTKCAYRPNRMCLALVGYPGWGPRWISSVVKRKPGYNNEVRHSRLPPHLQTKWLPQSQRTLP